MEAIRFESDLFSFEKSSNDHSEYWSQTIPDFFKTKKMEDTFSFLLFKFFKFRSLSFLEKKNFKTTREANAKGDEKNRSRETRDKRGMLRWRPFLRGNSLVREELVEIREGRPEGRRGRNGKIKVNLRVVSLPDHLQSFLFEPRSSSDRTFSTPPPLSLFFSPLPLFPLDSFYTPSRILVLLDCLKKKTQTTSRFRSPRTKA